MTSLIKDGEDCSGLGRNLNSEDVEVDGFYPDMTKVCENCGQYIPSMLGEPGHWEGNRGTVCGVKDNLITCELDMCGPCCWGQAAMLDPANWNKPEFM